MKKSLIWLLWSAITVGLLVYFGTKIAISEDKQELLIGEASHGHFQIELACDSCHTEAFGGGEVIQEACEGCHQEELKMAHDSHPKKKFTDPRNADTLEILDARYCVSCHTEHQNEQTQDMGVTLPDDYCFHCHQEVGEERPSHKDLPFDSCATSGCHNYHDNRALYEGFLVENSQGEWLNSKLQNLVSTVEKGDASELKQLASYHAAEAPVDSHHQAGIPCATCHIGKDQSDPNWVPETQVDTCSQCHAPQVESYKAGKHGMRLAQELDAIRPADSQLSFREESLDLQHSCSSCHKLHEPDPAFSAVESCLGCHNDEHSLAYERSPHGQLWRTHQDSIAAEELVTCATCHMPSMTPEHEAGQAHAATVTQHNQNDNLRPNEKMIRPVCMSCHSLSFSIDALADETLILNNFSGKPSEHVPSIDWALEREKK